MVRQGSAKPSSTSSNLVVTSKRFPEASASGIFCFVLSPADRKASDCLACTSWGAGFFISDIDGSRVSSTFSVPADAVGPAGSQDPENLPISSLLIRERVKAVQRQNNIKRAVRIRKCARIPHRLECRTPKIRSYEILLFAQQLTAKSFFRFSAPLSWQTVLHHGLSLDPRSQSSDVLGCAANASILCQSVPVHLPLPA